MAENQILTTIAQMDRREVHVRIVIMEVGLVIESGYI